MPDQDFRTRSILENESPKVFLIYKHTSPSGKSYIGQTRNLFLRNKSHRNDSSGCTLFRKAVIKYGWDGLDHEILKDSLTIDEANEWEAFFIKSLNTITPHGYNLMSGGGGSKFSNETRERMSISAKLKPVSSAETREKISKANAGKVRSDETKARMSIAFSGRICTSETRAKLAFAASNISDETRAKQSAARVGKVPSDKAMAEKSIDMTGNKLRLGLFHSNETKMKMSKSQTGRVHSQKTKDKISKANTGFKLSDETKVKLSVAAKMRKYA
jgi:group I intron endonuclease